MISISHSPNSTWKQIRQSFAYLILPWRWNSWVNGSKVNELEVAIGEMHGLSNGIAFSQAREGLLAILKALKIKEGDEVLIQGFTCIVLPNAIISAGAKPIFVDIDKETLSMDTDLIEQKITSRTKALILQHSFGFPADINTVQKICSKHNISLIEDCALSLGAKYSGSLTGTFGDFSFFSFGRDKVLSAVSGGMVLTKSDEMNDKIRQIRDVEN
mgnify:CR=1 FL=1